MATTITIPTVTTTLILETTHTISKIITASVVSNITQVTTSIITATSTTASDGITTIQLVEDVLITIVTVGTIFTIGIIYLVVTKNKILQEYNLAARLRDDYFTRLQSKGLI